MKKHTKHSDGRYHINGMIFEILIGSRAQVHHKTAYKTTGGLKKKDLKKNKHGKIVSRAKSSKGKQMLKRLTSKGYHTRKGHFGYVKKDGKGHSKRKGRGTKKRGRSKRKVHSIRGVRWEDRAYGTGKFARKPSYKRSRRRSKR